MEGAEVTVDGFGPAQDGGVASVPDEQLIGGGGGFQIRGRRSDDGEIFAGGRGHTLVEIRVDIDLGEESPSKQTMRDGIAGGRSDGIDPIRVVRATDVDFKRELADSEVFIIKEETKHIDERTRMTDELG